MNKFDFAVFGMKRDEYNEKDCWFFPVQDKFISVLSDMFGGGKETGYKWFRALETSRKKS